MSEAIERAIEKAIVKGGDYIERCVPAVKRRHAEDIAAEVQGHLLSSLKASGYVVVPEVATDEMIVAGVSERLDGPIPEAWTLATQNIYAAMISAHKEE